MTDYPDSYYAATANRSANFPMLDQSIEVETCVIGGGYAGLMTALSLIERGHKEVAVVEQNKIGWGASGRNGGFVFGGFSLGPKSLVNQVGKASAKRLYQMTESAVNLIRSRVRDYQIECDLVDQGVILANWFKDQALLQQQAAYMKTQLGVDWTYLPPNDLRQLIQTERYHGGLFEPNAMHFHPLNYALGIAAQIKVAGGKVFEQSKVTNVELHGAVKKITTENGEIHAKSIVLAGGGYLKGVVGKVARSTLPIATYVMATEELGSRLTQSIKTKAAVYDTRFAFDYYRPLNDSRILWGGRVSANTKKPRDLSDKLKGDLTKVFPELKDVKVDFAWDGWMSYARHQMAQIGQVAPNIWYGTGFGGHGIAPTTVAGEILAQAITNENNDWKHFQPWGLPWNGGVLGPAAAQMSYWWYQTRDWLKEKLE